MWYQSSKENISSIPPNLLKNFKPYDVVEPQKNDGAKNSDATKVDKLIDIDDSSLDTGYGSNSNTLELEKNKGFDLIDLYQNILVTPQHVSQNRKSSNTVRNVYPSLDIDFKQFFDKLEAGQKHDWMNTHTNEHELAQSQEEIISHVDPDVLVGKPRVLVPKVFPEPDSDPEDLIHEVITQKNIEKQFLSEVNYISKNNLDRAKKSVENSDIAKDFSDLSLNNSFTLDSHTSHSKFESGSNENEGSASVIKTCPTNSQINNFLTNFTVRAIQKEPKKKHLVRPENQKANFTKGPDFYEKSIVLPQIMARLSARQTYLEEISNHKKRLVLDAGHTAKQFVKAESSMSVGSEKLKSENSDSGLFSVKPERVSFSKDPKLCMNQQTKCIDVHMEDKVCSNCNKPPKNEKVNSSVNGPNIPRTVSDFGKLSPKVLMEDCNKERLRALKCSQMFKDFVLKGKYEI